ncbi:MAG TPA: hypothetical protein VN310_15195 [Candidatus Dormibacteraeota bacterium]|nr:hypothetical protein [Candidatus Dormibacteraeota bacterium]
MKKSRKLGLLTLCLALSWMATSCSSTSSGSKSSGNGSGGHTGLQFTSPTTSATVEVTNPAQTVSLAVNESVTWTLQSGCGFGKPVGKLSNETATTATYTAPATGSNATQPCNPWQDVIVATTTSNQSASLGVVIVQAPPGIGNALANTFTGELCTSAGGPCCPVGSATCCPQASITTIIQPPAISGQFGIAQSGQFTNVGPITASGGVPPYTWQTTSGSLPSGLVLVPGSSSATMSITGTPIGLGCSTISLQVTDANGVSSPGGPYAFNLVVIPASLKVTIPNYASSYNDPAQSGDPGLTYSPTALVSSAGTPPYAWVADPGNFGFALPSGLALAASSSNTVAIQGTPATGADSGHNNQGASNGLYPAIVQVNDSQLPYPAVGLASLPRMQDLAVPPPCSPGNQAGPIQPLGVAVNGGIPNGGSVSAESYLQGSVAFLLRGFDSNGPVVIAGSVAVDGNGGISGGEEDITRSSGSQHLTIEPTSANPASYYVVGAVSTGPGNPGTRYSAYSRGCMALATSTGTTSTFAFTLGGCSNHWTENHLTATNDNACGMTQNSGGSNIAAGYFTTGHIVEFDCTTGTAPNCASSTRAAGIMRWQDSSSFSAGLSGPYAFGLSGWDAAAARYAIAGSFQAGSGSMSSVAADINDAGNLSSLLTGGSGTYGSLDAYGNATGTLSAGQTSLPVSLYIVSKNEALIVTNSVTGVSPVVGGEAVATAASFSAASLANTHIFHLGGVTAGSADVSIGVLAFNGAGIASGTQYEDQAGTLGTTTISGTYAVDQKTGRATFSAALGQTLGPHPFVAYVIPAPANLTRQSCSAPASCFTGFLVGTDSTAQDGILEFQTPTTAPPPPFTNVYLAGDYAYGSDEILDQLTPAFDGVVYALPSGASTTAGSFGPNPASGQEFVQDVSYSCGSQPPQPSCVLLPSQFLSGSFSIASNGTGTFGGETVSVTNGNATFFIDESPVNLHPSVVVVEQ